MGIVLPRFMGPVTDLQAGEYTKETASGEPAVCCPLCSEISEIDPEKYTTERDGKIVPMWRCPCCPCIEWISIESPEGV